MLSAVRLARLWVSKLGIPPTFVYVPPPQGVTRGTYQGENVDVRLPVHVAPQAAPDPVRDSNFTNQGKPIETARSMQQIAVYFNIAARQAVMEDFFLTGKEPIDFKRVQPRGRQLPFTTRSNIDRPTSQPYGDQFAVGGESTSAGLVSSNGLVYSPFAQ